MLDTATTRVLILEDEDDHAELLELALRGLTEHAFDFVRVREAGEALERLEAGDIDVVISDYRLETGTAEAFVSEARHRFAEVPIIVTTCHGDEYVAAKLSRAGASAYLRKADISKETLHATITDALAQSQGDRGQVLARREALERMERLTAREREVLDLILGGLLTKQIAAQLGCAEGTIKIHRARIMDKMGATTPADLARLTILARGDEAVFQDRPSLNETNGHAESA